MSEHLDLKAIEQRQEHAKTLSYEELYQQWVNADLLVMILAETIASMRKKAIKD